jgi:surface protein
LYTPFGDGNTDTITAYDQAEVTHTYATGGEYTVTITGTIEGWSFIGSGDCQKLTSITNIGQLKLGNENGYFLGCSNLTTIGGTFDLTGVTNLSAMFYGCTSLTSINGIGSWDVSAVTNMGVMFFNATSFNQPIGAWNTAAVTDMYSMFNGATAFNQPLNTNGSSWDVSSVTDMSGMFVDATSFNQDISGWNTSAVTSMASMFELATAFNQPLNTNGSSWDVSSVTDMNSMFAYATAFNQDISGWNTSAVTSMGGFMTGKSTADYDYYDDLLNAWSLLTLQNGVTWDMGTIEYTSAGATARQDIIDNYLWSISDGGELVSDFISVWDTTLGDGNPSIILPLVASGNYNFSVNWGDGNTDTITAYNQAEVTHTYATGGTYTVTITGTIEGWSFQGIGDCQKLTSITNIGQLKLGNEGGYFYGCSNLVTIGGTFDLTGTTNLSAMFYGCTSLTSVNGIGSWDVSSVTNMNGVFTHATLFNGDISGWDVPSVINMYGMFAGATSFNQDISGWDVSFVTNMESMFYNATAFNQDISSWDVSGIIGNPTKPEGMVDFMGTDGDPLSFSYYDNLLNAWSLLTLQNNVTWGMGPIEYTSAGAAARASIISNYSWVITDGGLAA